MISWHTVNTIFDAIDRVVGAILKPVTDFIQGFLKKVLNLVEFPNIDMNFLPFGAFDQLAIGLPAPPDFDKILDGPQKLYDKFINELPAELRGIGKCGKDMPCIQQQLGLGDITNMIDPVVDAMQGLTELPAKLADLAAGLKCAKPSERIIPCSDALKAVGFPDINECDMKVRQNLL